MNLYSHLNLFKRHFKAILIILIPVFLFTAYFGYEVKGAPITMLQFLFGGLLAGIILGGLYSFVLELTKGVLINPWQVEKILNMKIDEIIKNKRIENYNISYLMALLRKYEAQNILIVGVDFLPANLEKAIQESQPKLKVSSVMFPDDALLICDTKKDAIIVACGLGKSKIENIAKLSKLLTEKSIILVQ
jgi:hypothetical protein